MNRQTLSPRLTSLDTNDGKAVEAFMHALITEACAGPRALVDFWEHPAIGVPRSRLVVLIPELEGLAIKPLLDVPTATLSPADHVWLMRAITEAEVALRNLIIQRWLDLLGDATPVPQPTLTGSEGQPLPRRICDEAYLALRELMKSGEDSYDAALNTDAFLSMVEVRRDQEIKKLKDSKTFSHFAD